MSTALWWRRSPIAWELGRYRRSTSSLGPSALLGGGGEAAGCKGGARVRGPRPDGREAPLSGSPDARPRPRGRWSRAAYAAGAAALEPMARDRARPLRETPQPRRRGLRALTRPEA